LVYKHVTHSSIKVIVDAHPGNNSIQLNSLGIY